MSKFINSFKHVPLLLFRLNSGKSIKLREYSARRSRSFDVLSEAGTVKAKALTPSTYEAPNGASMRPLGEFQTALVENFKGSNVTVYAVPEGTQLPDDLILVHEHTDHYSLQPAVDMPLSELNEKITAFLRTHGTTYSRDEWLATFQQDEPAYPEWVWSEEYQMHYYYDDKGNCVWETEVHQQQTGKSSKGKTKKR
ncbi:uncharacterized protein F5Z01DRAFT_222722 [Emericellopsis atlantica]|uniref:Tse2 ADP-ribosyltransferase toxin domain-containing protein n=1 Tax=Emericellopsis atlantica TaxID=2614577 RepID=A0A9P8CMQ1_9HYPO|nr:uncharacterized protein F5Z01DRAFT_222722 [Emericellopsis atlantica]KAG9252688.1 hypothetical protein F5Z01DRAFT_222722 [Emericellopsis atlantica]